MLGSGVYGAGGGRSRNCMVARSHPAQLQQRQQLLPRGAAATAATAQAGRTRKHTLESVVVQRLDPQLLGKLGCKVCNVQGVCQALREQEARGRPAHVELRRCGGLRRRAGAARQPRAAARKPHPGRPTCDSDASIHAGCATSSSGTGSPVGPAGRAACEAWRGVACRLHMQRRAHSTGGKPGRCHAPVSAALWRSSCSSSRSSMG